MVLAPIDNILSNQDLVNLNGYIFDGYLNIGSETQTQITSHPVESGSPITDNAYREPRIFNLDIMVTETSQGVIPGQFGYNNRPINAYNLLESWQNNNEIISFNNRYGFYPHTLIKSISQSDDYTTKYALKIRVTLQEIIVTSTQLVKVSAASWMTDKIKLGNKQTENLEENKYHDSIARITGSLF